MGFGGTMMHMPCYVNMSDPNCLSRELANVYINRSRTVVTSVNRHYIYRAFTTHLNKVLMLTELCNSMIPETNVKYPKHSRKLYSIY